MVMEIKRLFRNIKFCIFNKFILKHKHKGKLNLTKVKFKKLVLSDISCHWYPPLLLFSFFLFLLTLPAFHHQHHYHINYLWRFNYYTWKHHHQIFISINHNKISENTAGIFKPTTENDPWTQGFMGSQTWCWCLLQCIMLGKRVMMK